MERKTNTCAVVGFILSFLIGIAGLIVSIVALNQIKKTGEKGKGLAIAGLVISLVGLVLSLILVPFVFTIFVMPGLQTSIEASTICNNRPGYTIGEVGEPGFVDCDPVGRDGTYVCEYVNADNKSRFITCSIN